MSASGIRQPTERVDRLIALRRRGKRVGKCNHFGLFFLVAQSLFAGGCAQHATGPQPVATAQEATDRSKLTLQQIAPAPTFAAAERSPVDAASASPDVRRALEQGRQQFNDQLWTAAAKSFEQALKTQPALVEARIMYACALLANGDVGAAEKQLTECLRYHPRSAKVHQLLADIAWQRNDSAAATIHARLALMASEGQDEAPERSLAHLTLAMALRKDGHLRAAADQFAAFARTADHPSPAMLASREWQDVQQLYRDKLPIMLADLQASLGDHAAAAAAFERASKQNKSDVSLRSRLMQEYLAAGRVDAAIDLARDALLESPEDAVALENFHEICVRAKKPERFDGEIASIAKKTSSSSLRRRLVDILIEKKRSGEAIAILERLLKDAPDDVPLQYQLATLQATRGEAKGSLAVVLPLLKKKPNTYPKAEAVLRAGFSSGKGAAYREAVQRLLDSGDDGAPTPEASFLVGLMQNDSGAVHAALETLEAAHQRGNSGPIAALLTRIYAKQKRWEDVIRVSDLAISHGATVAEVYLAKGRALEAMSHYEQAELALAEAIKLDPTNAEPLFIMADSADRRDDRRRCETLYRRIVDDVDPRYAKARERLIRLYLNSNRVAKAQEYFGDFEKLRQGGPEMLRCKALLRLTKSPEISRTPDPKRVEKEMDTYRSDLRAIIAKYPDDAGTYLDLALSYKVAHKYTEALAQIEFAQQREPENHWAVQLKLQIQTEALDFEGAEKSLRILVKLRPSDSHYQEELAQMEINLTDFDAAIPLCKALAEREDTGPAKAVFVEQYLRVLQLAKKTDEAIAVAKDWLDESPRDKNRLSLYLVTLRVFKKYDDMINTLAEWREKDPNDMGLRFAHVDALLSADRNAEAQSLLLGWMDDTPDDLTLNLKLLQCFWNGKDWASAIELAQTGTERANLSQDFQTWLGISLAGAKRYDEAIAAYRAASSGLNRAFFGLINALIDAKRFDEAEQIVSGKLQTALQQGKNGDQFDPYDILRLRDRLRWIYLAADRPQKMIGQLEARFEFLSPLRNTPTFVNEWIGVNNDLGYTLVDNGQDLDRAEAMIRFAVGQAPSKAEYLDSFGWILYKRGRFKDAIVQMRRAIKLRERDDAVLYDHMGDCSYRLGLKDEAKKCWQRTIELSETKDEEDPNPEEARAGQIAKKKLESLKKGEVVVVAPVGGTTTQPAKKLENDE